MGKYKFTTGLIAFLFACVSCAPVRLVKPLEKGSSAVAANLGGPLIDFGGIPIFIPYTSAFYAKGFSKNTSGFGSLHLTALTFGVFQTDIGICHELYYSEKFKTGISISPALNFAIDRWEWQAKLWPQLDMNIHKEFGKHSMLYGGISNWFEPAKKRVHGEDQPKRWYLNPHMGYMYSPSRWSYGAEVKWVAPGVNNQPNVVDYIGPNHMGAIGVYFQLMRRF